jgi:hypothetical protein
MSQFSGMTQDNTSTSYLFVSRAQRAPIRSVFLPSNKPLQRSGVDKVPGRGRGAGVLEQVPRARVLRPFWPAAERGC